MNYNKTMIAGRITHEIEVRYTPTGTAVCDISLATNSRNKDGEELTTFTPVTLWGKTAELAGQYLSKGSPLFVEGRLHTDIWQDKETGKKRSKLKVVGDSIHFVGSPKPQVQQKANPMSDELDRNPPETDTESIGGGIPF